MYLNITASKDTYIHNKILNSRYRTTDSNVGNAGTLDLFKLYNESPLPSLETKKQSEIVTIKLPDHDVEEQNLDGKYFFLYDDSNTKYYVWFSIVGQDTEDPSVENATGIEVQVTAGDVKTDIAAALTTAVDDIASLSASDQETGEVLVTVIQEAVVLNASNGNIEDSEFEIAVTQQGAIAGEFNLDTDGDGLPETSIELSRLLLNFDLSSLSNYQTLDVSHSDFKATLRLYDILDGQMAPTNFNVEIFPLANTFTEGIGRDTGAFNDLDICNFVTASYSSSPVLWNAVGANEKGNVGESGIDVYASMSDGADGFDQLYVTKEFIEGTEPFEFDVTNIIKQMVLENIPNHGFRISFSELEEQNGKTYFLKRFASRHVLNKYLHPRLTISWNDSFRDNSKNAIFDIPTNLIFQNTERGTPAFATLYEKDDQTLNLNIATGSWSSDISVSRATAYGDTGAQIPGMYSSTFTLNILDGESARVVSSEKEVIRVEFVDHNETSENLIGKYFSISSNTPTTFDLWFGLEGDDPPAGAANPVQITIEEGQTATEIAKTAQSVIDALEGVSASVFSLGVVHITLSSAGQPETLANAGTVDDDDFSVSRYTEGNSVTLQDHIVASGSVEFTTTWSGESNGSSVALHTGTLKVKSPSRSAFNATRKNVVFSLLNAKKSYKVSETAKLRIFSRDLNEELKSSKISYDINSIIFDEMYYRVRDVSSGDLIIPFEKDNNGTRVSTDSAGMYFDIVMSSLFPGRSYTIDLLIITDGLEIVYECKNTRFKVEP